MIFVKKVFKTFGENKIKARKLYYDRLRGKFMAITIAVKWKNLKKRYGPNQSNINLKRIRHALTLKGQS